MFLTQIRAFNGRQLNAASRKSLEIHVCSLEKRRTLSNQRFVHIKVLRCCNTSWKKKLRGIDSFLVWFLVTLWANQQSMLQFRQRKWTLIFVWRLRGSYKIEKVLNFSSFLEKSLNSVKVPEEYLISLGLQKSLKFSTSSMPGARFLQLDYLAEENLAHPLC